MQIATRVQVPCIVEMNGLIVNGTKVVDVLSDGEVLVVFPVRPSQKLHCPSCAVRVQDRVSGLIITVQAFNSQAYILANKRVGESISATGKMKNFRGGQYFNVDEFLPEPPVVHEGRVPARAEDELDGPAPALPSESLNDEVLM